jgi:hypothetical protein
MNKEALRNLLTTNTHGQRLELPLQALQSPPVTEQFGPFLGDQRFILKGATAPKDDGGDIVVSGTGDSGPFDGIPLAARFIAADPVRLIIRTTQNQANWALVRGFPKLEGTLAGGLLFDDARLQFASQVISETDINPGLWFQGRLNLASSLGSYLFLIGSSEMVFSGQITAGQDGIPEMQLTTQVRGGTSLKLFTPEPITLFTLEPITLRLLSRAALSPRRSAAAYPRVYLEFHSGIQITSQGQPRSIPLTAYIYDPATSIRLDADLTQGIVAALDQIKTLLKSNGIDNLKFADFKLENEIKLTRLTIYLNPSASTKVSHAALSIESAQTWPLLKDRAGNSVIELKKISVTVGLSAPFAPSNLSAYLEGQVKIGTGCLILSMAASAGGATLRGYLDNDSPLALGDLIQHFVNKSDTHTPSLQIYELDILVQPGNHYELNASMSDLWSITLHGEKTFSLDEVALRLSYTTTGQQTEAQLSCLLALGLAELSLTAAYSTTGGWDVQGGLSEGQTVEVSSLLADLEDKFGITLPEFLHGIRLDTFTLHFNTSQKKFNFEIGGDIPVEGGRLKSVITLGVEQVTGSEGDKRYKFSLGGSATISGFTFTLDFLHDSDGNYFWATYPDAGRRNIRSLIAGISTNVAQLIPEKLEIEIKSALFIYAESKFLFGLRIGTHISLGQLPVVGKAFPEQTVGIDDLQVLIASREFKVAETKKLTGLISTNVIKLPEAAKSDGAQGASQDDTKITALDKGLNVSATLKLPDMTRSLSLPAAASDSSGGSGSSGATSTTQPSTTQPAATGSAKWFKIQKSLGPFYLERIGLQYQDPQVWFLLDATLSGAGLTLSLDRLAVKSPLTRFAPEFDLQGLGIAFKKGDLEIGGALLKRPAPAKDAYDGALVLRYKSLAIEAVGSYETIDDRPSLFIYALIDYPLGGPAFFYVEGGAVGFGYNRSFTMPTIEKVGEFPLVKQALAPSESKLTFTKLLDELRPYVKPTVGEYFIAAGVKFTSFKTIKGFVLLTILFGEHVEIDVLGKATLTSPAGVDSSKALMSATLLFLGRFLPKEGFLMIMAQLAPDARLFAPDCHLSGGFAWYCWFDGDHKGDFALTLGGYHKLFSVPDHYPRVPRLAMNWQVNSNLSLKAEAYFALTPSALMAGGKLEINWQSGNLQAWLRAEIDFLMGWQPFYYNGHAYVALGVRYRFEFFGKHEISAELTAQLDIWGPEFSGRARVQWNLLGFEVSFGPAKEPQPPKALEWVDFRKAFLPKDGEPMFTVTAEAGKVAQGTGSAAAGNGASGGKDANLGCLNPRNLCIAVRSPLPIKDPGNDLLKNALDLPRDPSLPDLTEPVLGIAPMNKKAAEWKESRVTITISRIKDENTNAKEPKTSLFKATRIRNNVPASLWGQTMDPKDRKRDDPQLLKDVICGYELRLSSPVEPTELYDPSLKPTPTVAHLERRGAAWLIDKLIEKENSSKAANDIAARLRDVEVRNKRNQILNGLLPQILVDWTSVTIDSWRGMPGIVKSST